MSMAQTATRAPSPRRAEMVAAAARLFSARGYHGTSMKHLGDALGLLKGSLYAHIGSKEELLFDVVDEGAARFLERGREALELEGSAAGRLESFLVGHIETAIEHLDAATVFLNEWRYLSHDLQELVKAKRDAYEAIAREIVSGGIASGEFRPDADVDMTARLVLSAGNWVYAWYRPGGEFAPDQIARSYAEILVRGLRQEGTS
ncbi:MAG: TetR/AcrR family transcriptional regulator [Actinomycetota bacterium]